MGVLTDRGVAGGVGGGEYNGGGVGGRDNEEDIVIHSVTFYIIDHVINGMCSIVIFG
jgi:hypothetical protein